LRTKKNSELLLVETSLEKLQELTKRDKHLKFLACQIKDLSTSLATLKQRQGLPKPKMNFEWVDSTLVKAIENGEWLLIDNANFCSPSVLDRLNPLLEINGNLQINEKGIGENGLIPTIKAHKNFRIILCVNEAFGELSRPMRNRGVEIYLNELTNNNDENDEKIILQTLYTFNDTEFNYFYSKLAQFETNQGKKLNFPQTVKVFKLIHDYWLINSSLSDYSADACMAKAIAEYQIELREITYSDEKMNEKNKDSFTLTHYYANTTNLKDFPLYRFLFKFPLYRHLISSIHKAFTSPQNHSDLKNYSNLFINTVKLTQLIEIWMRNIPLGTATNIMKFVHSSLTENRLLNNKILQQKVYELFEQVALKTFNLKQNQTYQNLITSLNEIAATEGIDLMEEVLDLSSNRFLYQRLKKRTVVFHLSVMSSQLKMEILFNLAKYRIGRLYLVEADSVLALAKSVETNVVEENSVGSFKFLTLFEEFFAAFAEDLMSTDETLDEELVKDAVYLFEKFYMICASRFDVMLTG